MPPARQSDDDHTTDRAELGVRAEGANQPIVTDQAQLDPGEASDPDHDLDRLGDDDDSRKDERRALVDKAQQERDEDAG